jgi:hypothetical protein
MVLYFYRDNVADFSSLPGAPVLLVIKFHKDSGTPQITGFEPLEDEVWGTVSAGTITSVTQPAVPSEYNPGDYAGATYTDVTLTDIDDNGSFDVTFTTTSLPLSMENFACILSTIGFTTDMQCDEDMRMEILQDASINYSMEDEVFLIPVTLTDGEATMVLYFYRDNVADFSSLPGAPVLLVIKFHKDSGTPPGPQPEEKMLTKIAPAVGQFENENALYGLAGNSNATFLIVPADVQNVEATLTFAGIDFSVSVNDVAQEAISDDNTLVVSLNATMPYSDMSVAETANTIKVSNGDKEETYTIWVVNQRFDDLPDAVADYLCICSQYINQTYGVKPVRSLVGSNYTVGPESYCGPVSLGNFGGYITYYFENGITDDHNNPYGVDFIVYGNCFEASNAAAEPGQVWVSEDGNTWYTLAGSMHYEDYADWNYEVHYFSRPGDWRTYWTDSVGKTSVWDFEFPKAEMYPWHSFAEGEESSITLSGIRFATDYNNTDPPYGSFGYADSGELGTYIPGEDTSEWGDWSLGPATQAAYEALARNIAGNPYAGTAYNTGIVLSNATDGMDLAWAVDEEGMPVDVEGKEFHYVKIVTATNIYNGMTFEKSTEVNMVRVAQANDEPVDKTPAPTSIKIDGAEVDLSGNAYSAVVDGPFKVEVEAPEDAYVFINNYQGTSHNFNGIPEHKIVRVIVQQGEKEPVIYVINLSETTETPAASATLTLDANGGTVNGSATYTMNFDANMAGDPLPTPLPPDNRSEFAGWYAGLQPVDSIPAVVEDTTFVAHWAPKQVVPGEETVSVSFRLIGSTKATGDIELDKAEGEDPYNGAEYVTWIKTTNYTLTAGSTVADLIVTACNRAGLTQRNAQGGYVATVTAPAAYGGYELSEFTNGKRSGWMYTIGGAHPGRGVAEQVLKDGDVVILHYVNDYAMEVEDWAALGGTGWPSLYDDNTQYLNKWLDAEDVAPPAVVPDEPGTTEPAEEPFEMPFVDVPEDAFYYDAVAWAVQNGITNGTTETTFSPDDDCYREQIVTFLWRAAGEPEPTIESVPFVDLDESAYYYKAVLWAYEQGVTLGVDETHFGVGQVCTREQVVTFMYRAANKPAVSGDAPFTDVEAGAWYADAVKWAADAEITLGIGGGLFGTGLTCTRGQIVTFLYRELAE